MSHCSHKTTVDAYAVWPVIRDFAKAVTPLDAFFLMEARTYTEPSKAHIRRIKRERLVLTRRGPQPTPDATDRRLWNSAFALGQETKALNERAGTVERHFIKSNNPIVPERGPKPRGPVWGKPIPKSEPKSEWDADVIQAKIDRLEREHQTAMSRLVYTGE